MAMRVNTWTSKAIIAIKIEVRQASSAHSQWFTLRTGNRALQTVIGVQIEPQLAAQAISEGSIAGGTRGITGGTREMISSQIKSNHTAQAIGWIYAGWTTCDLIRAWRAICAHKCSFITTRKTFSGRKASNTWQLARQALIRAEVKTRDARDAKITSITSYALQWAKLTDRSLKIISGKAMLTDGCGINLKDHAIRHRQRGN